MLLILITAFACLPAFAAAEDQRFYPLYRLYHPGLRDHLYTANLGEVESAKTAGYIFEATYGNLSSRELFENQSPLYRLYNPKTRRHFYTDDNDELAQAVLRHGYGLEGILGFLRVSSDSSEAGTVYRLYNLSTGDHLYTDSWVEWGLLQLSGWTSEGVLKGRMYDNF